MVSKYKVKIFANNIKIDSIEFDSVAEFDVKVKNRLKEKGL
jgi:hypothetical protein